MQTQEIQTLTKTSIKLQEQLVRSGERLHQVSKPSFCYSYNNVTWCWVLMIDRRMKSLRSSSRSARFWSTRCKALQQKKKSGKCVEHHWRSTRADVHLDWNLWYPIKGVEGRLSAENASLTRERNNLSDILSNMQSMHGEMERNSSDLRRRAENQVTKLEARM